MVETFFKWNNFYKNGGAGGKFTGKTLKKIMKEENLLQLRMMLGLDDDDPWIEYLRAIRDLHSSLVMKEVDEKLTKSQGGQPNKEKELAAIKKEVNNLKFYVN